jgi:Tfp pilus assembly protein PilF
MKIPMYQPEVQRVVEGCRKDSSLKEKGNSTEQLRRSDEINQQPPGDQLVCNTTDGEVALAACARLIKATETDPELSLVYFARGRIYSKMGDVNHAIDDFTSAILLRPTSANSYAERQNYE